MFSPYAVFSLQDFLQLYCYLNQQPYINYEETEVRNQLFFIATHLKHPPSNAERALIVVMLSPLILKHERMWELLEMHPHNTMHIEKSTRLFKTINADEATRLDITFLFQVYKNDIYEVSKLLYPQDVQSSAVTDLAIIHGLYLAITHDRLAVLEELLQFLRLDITRNVNAMHSLFIRAAANESDQALHYLLHELKDLELKEIFWNYLKKHFLPFLIASKQLTLSAKIYRLLNDVNLPLNSLGITGLHCAVMHGSSVMVDYLIQAGANTNAQFDLGKLKGIYAAPLNVQAKQITPLMLAAIYNDYPNAIALIQDGRANINAKDDYGWTALDYALLFGEGIIVTYLLIQGATHRQLDQNPTQQISVFSPITKANRNETSSTHQLNRKFMGSSYDFAVYGYTPTNIIPLLQAKVPFNKTQLIHKLSHRQGSEPISARTHNTLLAYVLWYGSEQRLIAPNDCSQNDTQKFARLLYLEQVVDFLKLKNTQFPSTQNEAFLAYTVQFIGYFESLMKEEDASLSSVTAAKHAITTYYDNIPFNFLRLKTLKDATDLQSVCHMHLSNVLKKQSTEPRLTPTVGPRQ